MWCCCLSVGRGRACCGLIFLESPPPYWDELPRKQYSLRSPATGVLVLRYALGGVGAFVVAPPRVVFVRVGYRWFSVRLVGSKEAIMPRDSHLDPCVRISTHTAPD